jgi:hypothetical protein
MLVVDKVICVAADLPYWPIGLRQNRAEMPKDVMARGDVLWTMLQSCCLAVVP